jgi:hypothetical protein
MHECEVALPQTDENPQSTDIRCPAAGATMIGRNEQATAGAAFIDRKLVTSHDAIGRFHNAIS